MSTMNGKFKIGEPETYGSIYGYQKRRFPVIDENGSTVGHAKEEIVLDGKGDEVSKSFYTRNLPRPHGAKRFYASPEAMVEAFGGKIDRTAPKSALSIKRAANKVAKLAAEQAEEEAKAKALSDKLAKRKLAKPEASNPALKTSSRVKKLA